MFGLLKMLYYVLREFPRLLDIRANSLRNVPDPSKYLAMIMLSLFWCLAFGIYAGELFYIGYNMIGHVAVVTMCFVTWWTFRNYRLNTPPVRRQDWLRAPDRSSRCDEYTDEQREELVKQFN
jgi:hypothetical protein